MPREKHSPRAAVGNTLIFLFFFVLLPSLGGLIAVSLGKDVNWDLQNYHYYNPYAFYQERLTYDITPASVQTYLSPIMDLPFYWMARNLSAAQTEFFLGAFQTLNLSLLFAIFTCLARPFSPTGRLLGGAALCVVSALAPGFYQELGTTFNDNTVSIFGLAGLLLLIQVADRHDREQIFASNAFVFIAGLLLGAGTGLKLTALSYAIGGAAGLAYICRRSGKALIRLGLLFGAGGLIGFVATYGYWGWLLYKNFGSPFFPFYNRLFHSPYATASGFSDTRYGLEHLWEQLVSPVLIGLQPTRFNEYAFVDYRFPLLQFLLLAYLVQLLTSRWRRSHPSAISIHAPEQRFDPTAGSLLLIFGIVAYIVWLFTQAYYRSMIGVELLVPLAGWIVLERLIPSQKWLMASAGALGILLLTTQSLIATPRAGLEGSFIEARLPPFAQVNNALVVMLSNGRTEYVPYAYVIPSFPTDARFVRRPAAHVFGENGLLFQKMTRLIADHQGPLFAIFFEVQPLDRDKRVDYVTRELQALSFDVTVGACKPVETNIPGVLMLCEIHRN